MKIFIVGLGLMGASYAQGLIQSGHQVFGYDKNQNTVKKALQDQVIFDADLELMKTSDLIILALYPKDNVSFVEQHVDLFNHQLVTDIAGVKVHLMNHLLKILPKTVRYVSHHPMAGREKSGYDFKDNQIFKKANFLIVPSIQSSISDIKIIERIAKDLEFGKITQLNAKEHDKLIGYTSQLTHLIAVGLMLSDDSLNTKNATGDSFRDLTRIAKINETMWSELFIDNKEALISEVDQFIKVLDELKHLIKTDRFSLLSEKLKKAKEKRIEFDENKR